MGFQGWCNDKYCEMTLKTDKRHSALISGCVDGCVSGFLWVRLVKLVIW